jgi:FMN reductase
MTTLLTIGGSPTHPSRSAALLEYARDYAERAGAAVSGLLVRDLDAQALIHGRYDHPAIVEAAQQVAQADGLIIASPVYKAAYTGVLKSFLDVLPSGALVGKSVLPILSGAGPIHYLALDFAFKPVLSALGATRILSGLYLMDSQYNAKEGLQFTDPDAETKLRAALDELLAALR